MLDMNIKNIYKIIISFVIVISFWSVLIGNSLLSNINSILDNESNNGLYKDNYSIIEYKINDSYQFGFPFEKAVILRLDDVQGNLWRDVSIKLIDTVLEKNMSITLGVIPYRDIDKDTVINNYIHSKIDDPRIEIAQHGTKHTEDELLYLSENETYELTKLGLEKMINVLGIKPITYIPPYNEYNQNATKALSRLGFKILSSQKEKYDFDGNMIHVGYDVETKYSNGTELIPIGEIIKSCETSLKDKNMCVIMIHPQDYVGDDHRTIDEIKYNKFITLLNELKKLNTKYITFKDLLK